MATGFEEKKRKTIPFWLQICLILLCGIVLSGIVYYSVYRQKEEERAKNIPKYTVTFAYQDGTVIGKKTVSEGKGTFPPVLETTENVVFRGWSSPINEVTQDVETRPMLYSISDENLFYFDSVYVQEGTDFSIELVLSGKVDISSAELSIEYDPAVMDYKGCDSLDFCSVALDEPGKLVFSMAKDDPIRERTELSSIKFLAKTEDVYSTQITLHCEKGTLITEAGEKPATVTTINNNIYYLQEVE